MLDAGHDSKTTVAPDAVADVATDSGTDAPVIMRDAGFAADDWQGGFVPLADLNGPAAAIDVPSDADAGVLVDRLDGTQIVRIDFPSFSDGRGFTIAKRLREAGFTGRLRARGVIADQYAMARRSGFDEVEVSPALAARQPQAQWLARADWKAHDYQARLRG